MTGTSRVDRLAAIIGGYRSAEAALRAGNGHAACRHPGATPSAIAAGLCLTGFHGAAEERFRGAPPQETIEVFASALALLFTAGRSTAIDRLRAARRTDPACQALATTLDSGRIRLNFCHSAPHAIDRLHRHRAIPWTADLDVDLVTCSPHGQSDVTFDVRDRAFLRNLERQSAGIPTFHMFKGDTSLFPWRSDGLAGKTVRFHVDSHHNIARQAEDLRSYDTVVCLGPEAHDRLRTMLALEAICVHRISDFSSITTVPPAPERHAVFFSGNLFMALSPRREAVVVALSRLSQSLSVRLCDGRLPAEDYFTETGGAAIVPAILEDAAAIPGPRFHEVLASGGCVAVDDPDFFAAALPENAHQFVSIEELLEAPERAVAKARKARALARPLSQSEMHPVDQLVHAALAGLLSSRADDGKTTPTTLPRHICTPVDLSGEGFAPNAGPWMSRTVQTATEADGALACSDAVQQLRMAMEAAILQRLRGGGFAFDPAMTAELRSLAASHPRSGVSGAEDVSLNGAAAQLPAELLLREAALASAEKAVERHPTNLSLAYHRLDLIVHHAPCHHDLMTEVASFRRRAAGLLYQPWASDPGSPAHQALSMRLARRIGGGQITSLPQLARAAHAAIMALADQLEAWLLEEAGETGRAAQVLLTRLACDPDQHELCGHLARLWRGSRTAVCDGLNAEAFRLHLTRAIEVSGAEIRELGPPLALEAMLAGDTAQGLAVAGCYRSLMQRVERMAPATPQSRQDQVAMEALLGGQEADTLRLPALNPPTFSPPYWHAAHRRLEDGSTP